MLLYATKDDFVVRIFCRRRPLLCQPCTAHCRTQPFHRPLRGKMTVWCRLSVRISAANDAAEVRHFAPLPRRKMVVLMPPGFLNVLTERDVYHPRLEVLNTEVGHFALFRSEIWHFRFGVGVRNSGRQWRSPFHMSSAQCKCSHFEPPS